MKTKTVLFAPEYLLPHVALKYIVSQTARRELKKGEKSKTVLKF